MLQSNNVTMLPFYNDMHMLWHKNQTLCCNFAKMLPLLLTYLDDDSNLQFIIQNADDILNVIQWTMKGHIWGTVKGPRSDL